MGFLPSRGWLLLALSPVISSTWALSNPPTPGVTEVDLIFPRNGTYPPSPLTPFVFAIHNPTLLSSIHPRIDYHVAQYNRRSDELLTVVTAGTIELPKINYTSSDPYFLYWSTEDLVNIEGIFRFTWALHMYNCSHHPESEESVTLGYFGEREHQVNFSTRHGAPPPDFAGATDPDTCDESLAQAVHVADLLDVAPTQTLSPSPSSTWAAPFCAATLDTSPTPSPCKVKIDASAAASISAALTASACEYPARTGLSCPTPSPSSSSSSSTKNAALSGQFPIGGAWTWAITTTLLAYTLA